MGQNQKPTKPLHPYLAGLIGDYVINNNDRNRLTRVWLFVAGSGRRQLVSGSVMSIVTIGVVLSFVAYGSSFTFGKTQLGNQVVDMGASEQALRQQISEQAASHTFKLIYPDGQQKTFKLNDAGITVNDKASVEQVHQAVRHLGWHRFAWWQTTKVPLTITKNNKQLDAFIATNVAIANQPAKDASLAVKDGKPVISDPAEGSTYQIDGGNKQLVATAKSLKPLQAKLVPTTVKPSITKQDLVSAADKVTAYTDHSVSFVIGDRTIVASAADIGSWLDIEAVPAKKTADVTVNSGKVQAYVDKMTASSIFPAKAQINMTAADGSTQVLAAGRNGSAIANKTTVVRNVTNQLQQKGSVITANLEVTHDSFKTINAADYDKWLIADVSTKRMYAYEHGNLVRTFLISAGAPKTPTVLGTYKTYSKLPLRTMRGANADGSRYVQPNVKYVQYFFKDYAIHGNYWRPKSYFGNVNSSHGCIGITDSEAEWLYNWAPPGTTVITHS